MIRLRIACLAVSLLTLLLAAGQGALLERTLVAPTSGPQASALQGSSVAVNAQYVAVAAENVRIKANGDGAVKVYSPTTGALLHTILNPAPSQFASFGSSVALDGNTLVVGAPLNDVDAAANDNTGAVYVYDLGSATPTVPVRELKKATPTAGDTFGSAVAISGTTVAVGVTGADPGTSQAGQVCIFDLGGATPNVPVQTINHPSPAVNDFFGRVLALEGSRLVVGVPDRDVGGTSTGTAYVFDLSSGTPTTPVLTLENPSPAANDEFASAVALSGNRVAIGVGLDDTGGSASGLVYVFDVTVGTTPVHTITNPGQAAGDGFGLAVALEGAQLVVGATSDDSGGGVRAGAVHVFDLAGGSPGTPVQTLLNPTPVAGDVFGKALAVKGTRVVVGAEGEQTLIFSAGAAYVYELSGGSPTVPTFTLNDPFPSNGNLFGWSLASSGSRFVVGARLGQIDRSNLGSASVYDLAGATPSVPLLTVGGFDTGGAAPNYAWSVAIDGDLVAVGAIDDTGGGKVYIYDLGSATPATPITTLTNPGGGGDEFGQAVAIRGQKVLVGAPYNDTGATDAGRVYYYDLSVGTTPTIVTNPAPSSSDRFGEAMAISGNRLVIAARGNNTGASFAGSVYVYDLSSGAPTSPLAVHNPTPASGEAFGHSVALDGATLVVGAMFADGTGPYPGAAYVYDLAGATPTIPILTLPNPNPTSTGFYLYGTAVAVVGQKVAVGAYHDSGQFPDIGVTYIYDLANLAAGTAATPVDTLSSPTPDDLDNFSYSLAFAGGRLIVGAPGDSNLAHQRGVAYVYALAGTTTAAVVIATNAGATGAGLPAGSMFASFTAPDVGVFGGKVRTPAGQKLDAVFDETGTVLLRGAQMVGVDPAGSGDMGMIAKLAPPTGDAVLATLDRRSGATAENDQVLFGGLKDGTPEPLVRKGQEIPGLPGVKLKSFLTLDGNGDTTFFSGKLAGAGVDGSNNTAIFAAGTATGFKMIVRKGQTVQNKQVKIIATLVGQAGTLAEGRWRSGPDGIGVRLTFTDRTQALYLIRAGDTGPSDWLLLGQTDGDAGPDLTGAKLQSFNLPAYAPDATVFDSLLRIGEGGITKKDNGAIFDAMGVETRGPISLRVLAQRARPVPAVPMTNLQRFIATLAGLGRASTFVGQSTQTGTRGVATAIYDAQSDGTHRLLARVGDRTPDGERWSRFTSVAKPDGTGYGALVSALLAVSKGDGVTPANKAVLYGVDSTGAMRRLLRAGDSLESAGPGSEQKTVKSFVALGAAAGSIGAARGYDDQGRVSVLVTFADRTQAVVRIQIP